MLPSVGSRPSNFSSCGSQALELRLSGCGTWASNTRDQTAVLCIARQVLNPGTTREIPRNTFFIYLMDVFVKCLLYSKHNDI